MWAGGSSVPLSMQHPLYALQRHKVILLLPLQPVDERQPPLTGRCVFPPKFNDSTRGEREEELSSAVFKGPGEANPTLNKRAYFLLATNLPALSGGAKKPEGGSVRSAVKTGLQNTFGRAREG